MACIGPVLCMCFAHCALSVSRSLARSLALELVCAERTVRCAVVVVSVFHFGMRVHEYSLFAPHLRMCVGACVCARVLLCMQMPFEFDTRFAKILFYFFGGFDGEKRLKPMLK